MRDKLASKYQLGFQMGICELLKKKRDGEELTKDEIEYWITNMVGGNIADSQIGAMLMAMYIRGVNDTEAAHLTRSMVASGERLDWPRDWDGLLVDKHSTGGVGDKISLILAPVLAACGLKVPMVSGRSLEHTGGTLDKLQCIPGFIVDLDLETMKKALEDAGCFISAATSQLCPADRLMYRVRDVTCTVDAINLIVSSIVSKKVAAGAKFLVVDVKVGKAAFCKTLDSARSLARQLISVSGMLDVQTRVVLTRMDEPLGHAAGNALEVQEAVQCLLGNMPPTVARLISVLGCNLLEMAGYRGHAEEDIRQVIQDGSALERFRRMLLLQGVSEETVRRLFQGEAVLPTAKHTTQLTAHQSGWVSDVDAWIIGQVCLGLGAGRRSGTESIDPSVGVIVSKHVGERLIEGEVWLTVHHSCPILPPDTLAYLKQALSIAPTEVHQPDIIIEVIT